MVYKKYLPGVSIAVAFGWLWTASVTDAKPLPKPSARPFPNSKPLPKPLPKPNSKPVTKPIPSKNPNIPFPGQTPFPGQRPQLNLDNWNFEHGLTGWEQSGTAFAAQPTYGDNVQAKRVMGNGNLQPMKLGGDYWHNVRYPIGNKGNRWIGTYERRPDNATKLGTVQGDGPTGTLTSKPVVLDQPYISFLIGGGKDKSRLRVELLEKLPSKPAGKASFGAVSYSDGWYKVVPKTTKTGHNAEVLRRDFWDVRKLKGKAVRIRIVDNASGGWGHINVDDFRFVKDHPILTMVNVGKEKSVSVKAYRVRPGSRESILVDYDAPVWGVADLHTHPASHLGFGRKLMHGAPDGKIQQALANCNCSHGGWGLDNECGNYLRSLVVSMLDKIYPHRAPMDEIHRHGDHPHAGWPNFTHWPQFTTITHQQMRYEWMKRAHEGGLNVIVALAVNNQLLAEAIDGDSPRDDKRSADAQIKFMKNFVRRHSDFMAIAYGPVQMRDIIRQGKMAVVLGIEVDNIGNFNYKTVNSSNSAIKQEVKRLHRAGVRYIFPIHVTDNKFGGAAIYEDLFNLANRFASVQPLPPQFGAWVPGTGYQIERAPDRDVNFRLKPHMENGLIIGFRALLEAFEQIPNPIPFDNIPNPTIGHKLRNEHEYRVIKHYFLTPDPQMETYKHVPGGHRNRKGLSAAGKMAIKEMMKLGMIIDLDHMSERAVEDTLRIAEAVNGGYPLTSGHNNFRKLGASNHEAHISENQRSDQQLRRIMQLGGMVGVGYGYQKADGSEKTFSGVIRKQGGQKWTNSKITNNCGGTARSFAQQYLYAVEHMAGAYVGLGTDINGLVSGPGPRFGSMATYKGNRCRAQGNRVNYVGKPRQGDNKALVGEKTGNKVWDINTDGVAHYGMLPDFFQDLKNVGLTPEDFGPMFSSAEHFAMTWEKSVRASSQVR